MLAPLASNGSRRTNSTVRYVPPPTRGWNASDDLTGMDIRDAIALTNCVVTDTGVDSRNGYVSHVTGNSVACRALFAYEGSAGTSKLFMATAANVYDVTASGTIGAAVVATLTGGDWIGSMFATTGGQYLVIANGADSVRNYDGSAWTTPSITGVTSSTLVTVTTHMSRLWFVQKDTLKVWYLPSLAIAGAATSIDFGGLSKWGGYLLAMASWTRDGGSGMDDVAVFLTSEGEIHLYSGSDPASSTTWSRIGTFKIARPIGRRCFIKAGADIGIITEKGIVPLSSVLPQAEGAQGKTAISDQIRGAFESAARTSRSNHGWEVVEYATEGLVVVNVPTVAAVTSEQWVVNIRNGAWSRWTGMNAVAWAVRSGVLYWAGHNGIVYRYGTDDDNGAAIEGSIECSFQEFGTAREKHFRRIRAQFFAPPGYAPLVLMRTDYDDTIITESGQLTESSGTSWDEGLWDDAGWGDDQTATAVWVGTRGKGFVGAVVIKFSTRQILTYNGAKVLYEVGDAI